LPDKVLILTYYWPPSGGAGVQRWLKFAKYFPESGWEPIVLTVDPDYAAYPVTDSSLTEGIPLSLKVYKTPATDYFRIYKKDKSRIPSAGFANNSENTFREKIMRFIRGNLFIPDPRRGWNKFAFEKACSLIETEGIKHVITTSPPHSTQLIGLKLKKKYRDIKWIADLRDPWTDIYYYNQFYPSIISRMIDRNYERRTLKFSDNIITVGKSLKDLFCSKLPEISGKTQIITNGYDSDDFEGLVPSSPDIFTISYIGTLSDVYPIEGFLNALQMFRKNGHDFILRFIGKVSPEKKGEILAVPECAHSQFVDYVDHFSALRYMADSTILLLIIPDHKSNKSIITGKLFEYIASGKPVICLGPEDGDAAEILRESGHGFTYSYMDSKGISDKMLTVVSGNSGSGKPASLKYSGRELTLEVISLLGNH
jgi:glycosyltransferase involved in cell wall biosynthesis